MSDLILTGFCHSVYTRAVHMALFVKGLRCLEREVTPFSEDGQAALQPLHPFGRVPVLQHGVFTLYETGAILAYLDDVWRDPPMCSDDPKVRARIRQVQSIADAYVYGPLVRQAFGQAIYRPMFDSGSDPDVVAQGMATAARTLDALDTIAAEAMVLSSDDLTLADCHLLPMMEYFAMVPGASAEIAARPALQRWLIARGEHPAAVATRPDFVTLAGGPA